MNWIEVKAVLEPAPPDWSPLIEIFRDHGCENTLETDAPPALSACVVDLAGSGEVVESLISALAHAGVDRVETRSLADEDWEASFRLFFKPRRVGDRFVVRPTWEAAPLAPGDLEIVLDPGQAFGTGDHPTTRMCLQLLERADVSGKHVADVGCGSGILSIGAKLLGAATVSAVDIDTMSVEVAKENAATNRVAFKATAGDGIEALQGDRPLEGWDVILSNIISATLIGIAPEVAAATRKGGAWIVSGIIVQNWPDVREAAERSGLTLEQELEDSGWIGATFRK